MTNSTIVGRGQSRSPIKAVLNKKAALFCALLAGTCISTPALAQQAPYKNVDDNGVDLTDGSFNFNLLEGSIGAGESQMQLVSYIDGGSNWPQVYLTQALSGSTYSVVVSLGNVIDSFTGTSTTLTSTRATGATLSFTPGGDYLYRYADGRKVTFHNNLLTTGPSNLCTTTSPNNCTVLASTITNGDGLTITYTWTLFKNCVTVIGGACTVSRRLSEVANNAGYAINFTFVGNTTVNGQNPPPAWFQRATAQFTNANVSSASWPTVTYAYPSSTVRTVTTAGGKVWRFTEGTNSWAIKRPGSGTDTTTVALSSNVVTSVTREGVTTSYSRTVSGSTATMAVTDAAGNHTTIVSDMNLYRPTKVTDANGKITSYSYDTLGNVASITNPELDETVYQRDGRGNVTTTTRKAKPTSGQPDIVTTAMFDPACTNALTCNKPNWTRDALSNETDYTYDTSTGNVLTITSPAASTGGVQPKTTYSYTTTSGLQLLTGVSTCQTTASCVGTADEVKTTIGYNTNLLPTTVTKGAGDGSLSATTTTGYDAIGNVISVDGPLPGSDDTSLASYDADRAKTDDMLPDPDGTGPLKRQAHRYTYNADGQMTLVELGTVPSQATDWTNFSPVEAVQSTYDTNARKTRDVLTAGGGTYGVSEYSYDTSGRQDCVATRMNTTLWGTPLAACTAATPGSDGPDRISRVTLYDALNRPKEVTTAYGTTDASVEKTAFTDNGKTASVTDAENNLTSHVYDGFDRLSQTQYPSPTKGSGTSSTSDYEQLGYDANSNVTSRRLRDGTSIGYAYDNLNRLTTKDLPGAELDVTYAYDLLGRLKSAATSAQTVSLDWDALGRQTSEAGPLGTMGYQYDAASNGTAIVWPDSNVMTYTYDATSTMTGIYQGAGTSIVMTSYVYDDLGRRTATNRRYGANTSYSYDAVSRLGGLSQDLHNAANNYSFGFTYNAAGQLASRTSSNDAYAWNGAVNADRTYTSNGLNQYGAAGTTSFGYDARGNLTTSGASTYAYSAENLLISAPGATLTYDPLGRLYQITTGSTTTRFQYIGNQIAAEYDGSNNRLRRYVPGASTDEPSFAYEGSGLTVPTWFHTDERGSVIATSDSNGLRVSSNSYDEYGIPSGSTVGRFGYTGQAYLPEIGMSYYKARMYSPTLGRFMQTDPIGYGDGLNWYNYVGSDPVNGSDPMGLKCMVGSQQFAYDEDGCNAVGGSYSPDPDVVVVGSRGGGGIVGGGNSGRGVSGTPSTGGGKGNGIKNIIRPPVVVPTCHPTPAQLANSGKVSFKFGEVSASRGVTSGNTQGSFTTAGGYSGTFRSSFDGAARGAKGFGAAAGTGWSESLATFQGVNYNLVGTLGIWDISDNFDPNSGRLVGETDAISPVGVVLGGTRSNTTILTLTCPRSN